MDFNIQEHLQKMEDRIQANATAMENRIRVDIQTAAAAARRDSTAASIAAATALATANAAVLSNTQLEGRVKPLEEKAGWIGAAFGVTFVTLCGMAWKMVTGHP